MNDDAIARLGVPPDRWKGLSMPREMIEYCLRLGCHRGRLREPHRRDGNQEAWDLTPILYARFCTAFPGRGIGGQPLPRLLALAGPRRAIPAGTEAGADRAGGYLVVLADGRRLLACGAFGAAGYIDVDL